MSSVPEESVTSDATYDDYAAVTDLLRRLDEGTGARASAPAETDAAQLMSRLDGILGRREQQGLALEWTPATAAWVDVHTHDESLAARWVDQHVTLPLWRFLQGSRDVSHRRIRVDVRSGQVVMEPLGSEGAD